MYQPEVDSPEAKYGRRVRSQINHILFLQNSQPNNQQREIGKMLTITDTARDKFKELMKEHEGKFLRVVFEGFG